MSVLAKWCASLLFVVVWRVPRILVLTILSVGFPYFTNVVQLLCSLSGWLHLNCSLIGTGFNGAKTNSRIAHNLGIQLMSSNCFATFFQQHTSYVCSDIYYIKRYISIGLYFMKIYIVSCCSSYDISIFLEVTSKYIGSNC